eukprot:gene24147-25848_t
MDFQRRSIGSRLLASIAAAAVTFRGTTPASASAGDIQRVVYHLDEVQKVHFVLGNMLNHVTGMGGPDKVSLALVVHGPALEYFSKTQADGTLEDRVQSLIDSRTTLVACGNTMRAGKLTLADLVPGFVVAEEGGVVRIAKLQGAGYLYIRP